MATIISKAWIDSLYKTLATTLNDSSHKIGTGFTQTAEDDGVAEATDITTIINAINSLKSNYYLSNYATCFTEKYPLTAPTKGSIIAESTKTQLDNYMASLIKICANKYVTNPGSTGDTNKGNTFSAASGNNNCGFTAASGNSGHNTFSAAGGNNHCGFTAKVGNSGHNGFSQAGGFTNNGVTFASGNSGHNGFSQAGGFTNNGVTFASGNSGHNGFSQAGGFNNNGVTFASGNSGHSTYRAAGNGNTFCRHETGNTLGDARSSGYTNETTIGDTLGYAPTGDTNRGNNFFSGSFATESNAFCSLRSNSISGNGNVGFVHRSGNTNNGNNFRAAFNGNNFRVTSKGNNFVGPGYINDYRAFSGFTNSFGASGDANCGFTAWSGNTHSGFSAAGGNNHCGFTAWSGNTHRGFSAAGGNNHCGFTAWSGNTHRGFSAAGGNNHCGFTAARGNSGHNGFSAAGGNNNCGFTAARGNSGHNTFSAASGNTNNGNTFRACVTTIVNFGVDITTGRQTGYTNFGS